VNRCALDSRRTSGNFTAMRIPWVELFFCACLATALPLAAQPDWPEFRGPTGQGHAESPKLPLRWSQSENIVWKQPVPGVGWSSPIVYRDTIFLTTALLDEAGQPTSLRALAYDLPSGRPLWNREVFPVATRSGKHAKNSHASPTPVAEGDRLYVHFGHLGTAALDLAGHVVWRQTELAYSPVHGNGGSPILFADKLIFNCDGGNDPFIVALDKLTGAVRWRVPRPTTARNRFSFSTPLIIEVAGRPQLITPGSGMVNALDPADGRELWRANYGEGFSVVPRPVFGHGMIFIGTGYERAWAYGIKVDGAGDITDTHVAWKTSRGAPNTPSMILVEDELYFVADNGVASCVDARTGELHWNERLGGDMSASPIHANGRIYFTNERGRTFVVKAGKQFELLAENDLGERTLASPAVSGPSLFIRTENHLYRIQEPTL
jgi:outer membrane protein assembly factor BamB